jgi:hypothetical protein
MSNHSRGTHCEGWWDQRGMGRQSMSSLYLEFSSGLISGSGADIIGPFFFTGTIDAQGQIAMTKDYVGLHSVDYIGAYDGEGLMWGDWHIGGLKDRWLIKLKRSKSAGAQQADVALLE